MLFRRFCQIEFFIDITFLIALRLWGRLSL